VNGIGKRSREVKPITKLDFIHLSKDFFMAEIMAAAVWFLKMKNLPNLRYVSHLPSSLNVKACFGHCKNA